jgi:hypothetical protein
VITSAVSVAVLIVVWRVLGRPTQWRGIHPSPVSISVAVAGALTFLLGRAWRFSLLLPRREGTPAQLLGGTALSWGAGLLLPGPSADVAFVAYARANLGISVARGSGVAVIARIVDIVSLVVVAVATAAITARGGSVAVVVTAVVAGVGGLAALAVLLAAAPRRVLLGWASRVKRFAPIADRIDTGLAELASPRRWAGVAMSTALCRLATAAQYAALLDMVGLHLSFWQAWFVLSIRTLLYTVPIQGVAGIGTGQAWWTGALLLQGIPVGIAVPSGLTLQVVDLAVSLPLAGLVGLLTLWRSPRARERAAAAVEAVGTPLSGSRVTPREAAGMHRAAGVGAGVWRPRR